MLVTAHACRRAKLPFSLPAQQGASWQPNPHQPFALFGHRSPEKSRRKLASENGRQGLDIGCVGENAATGRVLKSNQSSPRTVSHVKLH